MTKIQRSLAPLLLTLLSLLTLTSCQAVRELANLRNVAFHIDQVADVHVAGVDVSQIRGYDDLRPADVLRVTSALARNELPLEFQLVLGAENPSDNATQARLVRLDWTLLLEDRETISGVLDQNLVLQPGVPQQIPIGISLDLIQFFDSNARDLIELALALSGQGGAPKEVALRATPTIDTPLGPLRYPEPIKIVSRTLGQ